MKSLLPLFVICFASYGFCYTVTEDDILSSKCYNQICWNRENYPAAKIITTLFEKNKNNFNIFGRYQEISGPTSTDYSCNLCNHLIKLRVSPVTIENDYGYSYFVVWTEHYQQNITLNICAPENKQKTSTCMNMGGRSILDQKMGCEQKYTLIKLLVYDPRDEKFIEKTLQYPSACVCTIQKLE